MTQSKREIRAEMEKGFDELEAVIDAASEFIDDHPEALDKVANLFGRVFVRAIGKGLDCVPDELIKKSAVKRAVFLCELFEALKASGFSDSDALQIVAGQSR